MSKEKAHARCQGLICFLGILAVGLVVVPTSFGFANRNRALIAAAICFCSAAISGYGCYCGWRGHYRERGQW